MVDDVNDRATRSARAERGRRESDDERHVGGERVGDRVAQQPLVGRVGGRQRSEVTVRRFDRRRVGRKRLRPNSRRRRVVSDLEIELRPASVARHRLGDDHVLAGASGPERGHVDLRDVAERLPGDAGHADVFARAVVSRNGLSSSDRATHTCAVGRSIDLPWQSIDEERRRESVPVAKSDVPSERATSGPGRARMAPADPAERLTDFPRSGYPRCSRSHRRGSPRRLPRPQCDTPTHWASVARGRGSTSWLLVAAGAVEETET